MMAMLIVKSAHRWIYWSVTGITELIVINACKSILPNRPSRIGSVPIFLGFACASSARQESSDDIQKHNPNRPEKAPGFYPCRRLPEGIDFGHQTTKSGGPFFVGCSVGLHVWNPCVLKLVPYRIKYMIGKGLFQDQPAALHSVSYIIRTIRRHVNDGESHYYSGAYCLFQRLRKMPCH